MEKEKLYTIEELEKQGIGSRVAQWRWREAQLISFYKISTRIFYSEKHIQEFLARHEKTAKAEKQTA